MAYVTVPAVEKWPKISFFQFTNDINQPTTDGSFDFSRVPPSLEGTLVRGISHTVDTFRLKPSETLKVADPKSKAPE